MNFELHTDHLKEGFSLADIDLIREQFLASAIRAQQLLKLDQTIQVHFRIYKGFAPWWGVGASAPSASEIYMHLHPDHFYLRNNMNDGRARFSATRDHELHHCARQRPEGPGYGKLQGEGMVSEGMAECFKEETGHPPFPDEYLIRGTKLIAMAERAKSILEVPIREKNQYLDSAGDFIEHYSVGRAVVRGWLDYTGLTAAAAYAVPAGEVLRPWLEGKYDIAPDRRPPWEGPPPGVSLRLA